MADNSNNPQRSIADAIDRAAWLLSGTILLAAGVCTAACHWQSSDRSEGLRGMAAFGGIIIFVGLIRSIIAAIKR